MQIEDIMKPAKGSKPAISVNQEESIANAATLMKQNNKKDLLVVNDDDRVVGKVTREDIVENSDELNEDFFID